MAIRITREEHLPYALGLLDQDELAPYEVQTHREIDRDHEIIPLHSHPFWELGYVRGGREWDYVIGQDQYHIQVGDILLIPPQTIHGPVSRWSEPGSCTRDVIWISPRFMNGLAQMEPDTWIYENQDALIHLYISLKALKSCFHPHYTQDMTA